MKPLCIPAWVLLALSAGAAGQAIGAPGDLRIGPPRSEAARYLRIRAVTSHNEVAPGQAFHVALDINVAKGWVYYSPDPGGTGEVKVKPGSLSVSAGTFRAGEILWPPDKPHAGDGGYVNNAYEGRAIVYAPITVPVDAPAGESQLIVLVPGGQVCGEGKCIDISGLSATVTVTVAAKPSANPQWDADGAFASGLKEARTAAELKAAHAAAVGAGGRDIGGPTSGLTLWTGLGMALLAGLILNVMPCVLPVIPLKVLSLVETAGQSRRRFVTLGLAFAGGIVLFFVGLAAANIIVRLVWAASWNWGEHFQDTRLRIAMALLVVAMAANLFGLFTVVVPRRLAGIGAGGSGGGGARETHLSAAGTGVLTAILSTPCSFAILTLAFAWAQLQPLWLGTLAILLIGVGMAAPYAVLTALPMLVRKLPRPGRWMELLKQSMGFVLLVVAVWLISTTADQSYPFWVTAYGVVLAYCLWMWGGWVRYDAPLARKLAVRAMAVVLAAGAGFWMLRPPEPLAVKFEPFDEAKIAAARAAGRIVVVDFTAAWCLTCKTVEATVYNDRAVAEELAHRNVLAVKGDVTTRDLPANRMLYEELKEPGVPVTVVFPPGSTPPIRLYGLFGKSDLLNALNQAGRK